MTKPTNPPGVRRLEALNVGPRPRLAASVIKAVVAVPLPPSRKPQKPVEGQTSLF